MAAQAKALLLLLAACCLPAFSQTYGYDALNRDHPGQEADEEEHQVR